MTGRTLQSERLGPLPIINHFIQRLGLEDLIDRYVRSDSRCAVPHSRALGVLLRSIIVEREPIYRQQETVQVFASGMFGVAAEEMEHLGDDRLGRALDRLFDADRAALLTEVVVAVGQRFNLRFDEFHNDSTSVSFCGNYRAAIGRKIRDRTAPAIVYGFSKDHRPDLKQLMFILTTCADGGVPVAFRCADGNASDARTHLETWHSLRAVAGRADFLYVADSNSAREKTWTTSTAPVGALSPYCPAPGWKTKSFASGYRPTHPIGNASGTAPIRAIAMGRATVGTSIGRRCCRRKFGRSSGSGARCSRCARRRGGAGTSLRPLKSSTSYASGLPGRRPGCVAPPRSTFKSR